MSDDTREAQSKFDRPAATSGISIPAAPVAPSVAPAASVAPAVAPAVVAPPAATALPAVAPLLPADDESAHDAADDAAYDDEDLPLTVVDRLRRLGPAPVLLTAGSLGSLLFLMRAVTSHTTPVSVLLSAGAVTGLIFGVDSAIASVATYRASQIGRSGRAVVLALVGGIAAVVCAGSLAGVLVMILVLNS